VITGLPVDYFRDAGGSCLSCRVNTASSMKARA
jgi:hypothetical protein